MNDISQEISYDVLFFIKIFNRGWQTATTTNIKGVKTIYKIDKCQSSYDTGQNSERC